MAKARLGMGFPVAVVTAALLLAGPPAPHADTLEVSIHPTTNTAASETTPTLGHDGMTNVVVYTRRATPTSQGDIYYQRVTVNGVPMGSPVQVSGGATDERLNDVSGSLIVYTALDASGSGLIRVYDIIDGTTTDLMPGPDSVAEARIHGTRVAWVQGPSGATRIEILDLTWPALESITISGSNPATAVEVGERYAVWQERNLSTGLSDIQAYDMIMGLAMPVATTSADEQAPATFDDYVVWQVAGAPSSLWARNLTTEGAAFVVANPAGAEVRNPSIDGDLIGYESETTQVDVYLYRISDGTTYQVTDGPNDEVLNNVSGNLVAFVDIQEIGGGSVETDVAIADLAFIPDVEPPDFCIGLGGDADGDGWCTAEDNCPTIPNSSQSDLDADGTGDACDACSADADNDGVCAGSDNCPTVANATQLDADGDGAGDACDACALDPANDADADGICAPVDNCPHAANADQADADADGIGDLCDDACACEAPVANAGPDQSTHPGLTVVLDGSDSSHPAGLAIATYQWSLVSRPAASGAELANATGVITAFAPDVPGDYTFALVVTSATGIESAPDEVLVSTLNVPPVADAGADVAVTIVGTTVTLAGGGSYDLDGDPITWSWTLRQKPPASAAVLAGAATSHPQFVADTSGEYVVDLVVSDAWSASVADTVLVSFVNLPPVASAGPNHTAVVGVTVAFDGTGSSDPNGDPLTYAWSLVSAPAGSAASLTGAATSGPTLTPDLPGPYVVSLVVNDGQVDGAAANATLMALSQASQAAATLNQAMDAINALAPIQFKNPNMRNALTNKIQAVLADIEAGNYAGALAKLSNDVVRKTDGCAAAGAPDANDWIRNCAGQAQVYPVLQGVIALLEEIV